MGASERGLDLAALIDDRISEGVFRVDRQVYRDESLFALEMERIFESNWVYLCHESQVREPGSYFTTHAGRQPVFVLRQKDGSLGAFLNACPHRGSLLLPLRQGKVKSAITCRFHGWVFSPAGKCMKIKLEDTGAYPGGVAGRDAMRSAFDLTPLARLGTAPNVISVNKRVPARDLKELVALAKSKPGTLKYGSGGNGSSQHLSGEEFKIRTGTDMIHVPYKGTGPAVTDALGGHIDVVLTGIGEIAPHATSGDLRPVAIMSEARVAALPNVPTLIESGFPAFIGGSWMGVLGPANLPREVSTWLTDRILLAAQSDEFKQKSQGFGITGALLKGPETGAFMRSLSERFREAIDKAGITAD